MRVVVFQRKLYFDMENSATYFLLFLLLFAGCDTRRDLVYDPANSPIVFPLDLRYDGGQNAVIIDWEYLGIEPAARYQIWRVERDGIHTFSWQNLPAPLRQVNRRADVWDMMPIVDSAIYAGEKYSYILRTETAGLRSAEAPVGEVQIPGARLETIHFLSDKGTATVNWHLPIGVLRRYELLRSVDDAAAQVIFQSEDPAVASFTDVLIEGNHKYTYRLRNTMDRDVVLDSRDMSLHPYKRRIDFNIIEVPNAFVTLTPATFGSPALALIATSDAISVRDLNQMGYVGDPRVLSVPNRMGLRLESLSVAAISAGSPVVLLGGILSETKEVQLSAFQNGVSAISWQYKDWRVVDSELPTAMTVAPDGTIWVGVGQRLKVFSFDINTIAELGSYDMGIEGAIRSLAFLGSDIWMVTTQGEVFRTDTRHLGPQPVWKEVALPAGVFAVWVGSDPNAIFVLARDRVMVFNAEGQSVLRWGGLDDLILDSAGLVVAEFEEVYVWDAQNHIVLFKSVPASLVRFAEENPN